jgi:hypothetical protein
MVGITTLELPNVCKVEGSAEARSLKCEYHLDREMCLLKGKDGGLHLVVDPKIVLWDRFYEGLIAPPHSIETIREICELAGVQVHWPEKLTVPYSLGACQFPNGKVLMTGGDKAVASLLSEVVGEGQVVETEIPIVAYPTFQGAGIHCLIGEFPDFLC